MTKHTKKQLGLGQLYRHSNGKSMKGNWFPKLIYFTDELISVNFLRWKENYRYCCSTMISR